PTALSTLSLHDALPIFERRTALGKADVAEPEGDTTVGETRGAGDRPHLRSSGERSHHSPRNLQCPRPPRGAPNSPSTYTGTTVLEMPSVLSYGHLLLHGVDATIEGSCFIGSWPEHCHEGSERWW